MSKTTDRMTVNGQDYMMLDSEARAAAAAEQEAREGAIAAEATARQSAIEAEQTARLAGDASVLAQMAPEFAENTANTAGEYVTYQGTVYKLPAGHDVGTTWANTQKVATNLGSGISDLNRAVNVISSESQNIWNNAKVLGEINGVVISQGENGYVHIEGLATGNGAFIGDIGNTTLHGLYFQYQSTVSLSQNKLDLRLIDSNDNIIRNMAVVDTTGYQRTNANQTFNKICIRTYAGVAYNLDIIVSLTDSENPTNIVPYITAFDRTARDKATTNEENIESATVKDLTPTWNQTGHVQANGTISPNNVFFNSDFYPCYMYDAIEQYVPFSAATAGICFYNYEKTKLAWYGFAKGEGNTYVFDVPKGNGNAQKTAYWFRTTGRQDIADANLKGIYKTLNDKLPTPTSHVYTVEKDGTGDFDKLTEAVAEATKYMDSVVYLGKGEWDIIEEYGTEYINSCSSTQRGMYLKNRITLICSSDALIKCEYDGSRYDTVYWLSVFNSGEFGFTLINAHIIGKNLRYIVHDERETYSDPYRNVYKDCWMELDNNGNPWRKGPPCIGGGMGLNGYVEIDGCYVHTVYETSVAGISWHNTSGTGKSHLVMKNTYLAGNNKLLITYYGDSTEPTYCEISGCSMYLNINYGPALNDGHAEHENMIIKEWANEYRTSPDDSIPNPDHVHAWTP